MDDGTAEVGIRISGDLHDAAQPTRQQHHGACRRTVLVVWHDYSNTGEDQSYSATRAQIFNADGSVWGDEFLVNTTTQGPQMPGTVTGGAEEAPSLTVAARDGAGNIRSGRKNARGADRTKE